MFPLCRLCANHVESTDILAEISDLKWKLSFCCGWKPSENEIQMPQKACSHCVEMLDICWKFAESVWSAERKLIKLANEPVEVWSSELVIQNEEIEMKSEEIDTKFEVSKCPSEEDDNAINYSDDESLHSNTIEPKEEMPTGKKQPANDPFLASLAPEDYLDGGLISDSGVAKLKILHPIMETMTWNDCQYKCTKCDKLFRAPHNFYAHIRSMHMAELLTIKIPCFYCNSKHRREFSLNRHIATEHFPHLKYRCTHCSDHYWNARDLNKHRSQHNDVEYKCELCEHTSTNKDGFYMHVSTAHFKKGKIFGEKFTCDICNKVFTTKGGIRNHMILHTEKFDYICDQCGWKFQSKGNLKGHLASTHVSEKRFKCDQCNKYFKTKPQLNNHSKHHDDVKPYECSVCKRTFRRPYTLNVHMRSHTQVCPYTCRFCGKSFRHSITLQTHERSHTSEKPYACTNCEYRSTSKGNLNKHMMRVHSIDFRNHVYQRAN